MKKFICQKYRRWRDHRCIQLGFRFRDDLAHLVARNRWFRWHDCYLDCKSFDEDVDYYVPVAEIEQIENKHFEDLRKAGVNDVN